MNKHNGNGKGSAYENPYRNPESIPNTPGISILAAGDDETPTEVHILVKTHGVNFAQQLRFRNHESLKNLIEDLIAYRRFVFPDAPEINANVTLEE